MICPVTPDDVYPPVDVSKVRELVDMLNPLLREQARLVGSRKTPLRIPAPTLEHAFDPGVIELALDWYKARGWVRISRCIAPLTSDRPSYYEFVPKDDGLPAELESP